MSTFFSAMEGRAPKIEIGPGNPETLKYGRLWTMAEYRRNSPGEQLAHIFLREARPRLGSEVIDFGCGTGRGGFLLALPPPVGASMRVTLIDFVRNCLDEEIREMLTTQAQVMRFIKADLEQPIPAAAEYGVCFDVMEHIPPDRVDRVLDNILKAAQHVFFSISTVRDTMGSLIGEELHLTIQPYEWWMAQFERRGCVLHWSENCVKEGVAFFYVTAWATGQDLIAAGALNIEEEKARDNVRFNTQAAQGWTQAVPHPTNDMEVMLLGGGPTLGEYEQEIRVHRAAGVKLITLNGAYNWALERGLTPSAQIIVDARPFNVRFVDPVVADCKYLIASQVHPGVFAKLPKDRTYIWHTSVEMVRDILMENYGQTWLSSYVPGGSTVLLRAVPLLRMLGFTRFHLYGCDSCLSGVEQHHAYAQPENDRSMILDVTAGGRLFKCQPWMISQAQEFQDLIRVLGDEIELEVYGDGLLAHILSTGARLQDEQTATSIH